MTEPSNFHFWMDWGVQAIVGVGTLMVAAVAIFADAIKAKFVKLTVAIDSSRGTYQPFMRVLRNGGQVVALTSGSIPAQHYQLRVSNSSRYFPSHRTMLWLLKLDRKYGDDLKTDWRGEIPLTWQHEDFLPGPRVIGKHSVLADLVCLSSEGIVAIQVRNPPIAFPQEIKGACELWLTVQARSDESSSNEYRVHIKWDGVWDAESNRTKAELSIRDLS